MLRPFTISFAAPIGSEIRSAVSTNAQDGTWSTDGLTYTIALGDSESVTLDNIPAGVSYTVSEDAENYTSDKTNGTFTGDIAANDADTVSFTNTLNRGIDTGINLDSMPYIMILCLVAVCAVVLFVRKRTSANR